MRIIHCADLHIDSGMESNFSREQAKERKEEIILAYERMVKYAADNQVKIIILAGDVFDKSNIGKRAMSRFIESVLTNEEIDFIYLRGNHDNVDILKGLAKKPSNLYLFDKDQWTSYRYDNVVITGIEIDKQNNDNIYERLNLNKSDINIVTMHGQTSMYKNDKVETVNIKALKNHYIDYLALGHIHQYERERLDDRGVWCYSGCLEGRGFDELGVKGFVLLDIEGEKVIDSFVPFSTREFYEIEVDVTGISGILATNIVIDRINNISSDISKEHCVKFVLVGDTDIDTDFDLERIKEEVSKRFYFVKVYNRSRVRIDYSRYENDASLKGEFIRMMKNEEMDEERKMKIIELGLKALTRKEVEL